MYDSGSKKPEPPPGFIIQSGVDVVLWIIVPIFALTVALPTLYLFLQGTPYERGFLCDDDTLNYPYKPDTITTSVLIATCFSVSVLVILLTEILNCLDKKCRRPCQPLGDMIQCVKCYAVFLVGFIMQEIVVEVVKNKMGVLRPNFLDVCRPSFNKTLCPGYISQYKCTGDEYGKHTVQDSRKSFPSGHAAFSMYIAVFFCIHIQHQLKIRFSRILKLFLQSGLIFLAILCGLGRVKDNKHHFSDVIAGFTLGSVVAIFVCRTVGRAVYGSRESPGIDKLQLPLHSTENRRGCCCSSKQITDSEPQTPSPLLQHEYFHRNITTESSLSQLSDKSQTLPPIRVAPVEKTGSLANS